jgi:hypothetical protein
MSNYLSATISPPLDGGLDRSASCRESQISVSLIPSPTCKSIEPTRNRPHPPIYTLNDDALLNIFDVYRLVLPDKYRNEIGRLKLHWDCQHWWYKLAQVCQQWRYLILASPSYLDLHLFCTYGVPVVDMLAHSPPLPLTIFYSDQDREMTAEDEEGVLLVLSHHDHVCHICLQSPASTLWKLVMVMDGQFPILEHLYVVCQPGGPTILVFPRTFQAPNLCHLGLVMVSLPIGSPLLTTMAGLVTLKLMRILASAHLPPNYLLTRLSIILQLEVLMIRFHSPLPSHDLQRQLLQTPNMTQITLPNLCCFEFQGTSAYLEGLVAGISTPVLSVL